MTLDFRPVREWTAQLDDLVTEGETAGGDFLLRLREEWRTGKLRFDRPGEFLLGGFDDGRLVAIGGVSLDPYDPRPGLGRVRHIYVRADARGRGIARALMNDILDRARGSFDTLRLRTSNPAAARLYEDLGFVRSAQGDETHRLRLA